MKHDKITREKMSAAKGPTKSPELLVKKWTVYMTTSDKEKIDAKFGSPTEALKKLLFDMAVQEKVDQQLQAQSVKLVNELLEKPGSMADKVKQYKNAPKIDEKKFKKEMAGEEKTPKKVSTDFLEQRRKLKNKVKE